MQFSLVVRATYGVCVAAWLLAVLTTFSVRAYGYMDPGSGLLALQVVGSTIAGMGFLVRKRVLQFFARFSRTSREGATTQSGDS
jgi:hypothetical protein